MNLGVAAVGSVWTERMRVLWVPRIGLVMDSGFLFSDWHIFYRSDNRFGSTGPESAEEPNARLLGGYPGL